MHRVMIRPARYETAREAVEQAFEIFPCALRGKKVLIKPNVLRASEPAEAIATHPAVLSAVVAAVAERSPASIVVGDNPGLFSYGANEEAFERTGLMAAAGKHYRNIGNDSVRVPFNPEFMPSVGVSRAVIEADVFISLPKFKTHGLTVLTGAVKNSYGVLPGAQKARLHKIAGSPAPFHDVVVEVFKLRVPDLFIVDAVVGMEGNGPASTELRQIGRILASDNAVAMDAVIATMMGLDPGRLKFLRSAAAAGLGSWRVEDICIDGELEALKDFKLPPLGGEAIVGNAAIQEMMRNKTLLLPRADRERCTACGTCIEQCPVEALTMVDDLPQVDRERCVTCFCCQEICPEKAMTLD